MFLFVFFFKQKTAYEMRISDWSSDVCSSDLGDEELHRQDEEGDEDDNPGDEQHRDLDEVGKEAAESHQIAHGVQQRFAGVEPGGGDAAGLHEIGETDAGAAGLQTETGEAVEHDAGER